MIDTTTTYLGPARLRESRVELPDGRILPARFALALPYRPADGDEVLVISNDDALAYVIGVLEGHGETVLKAPGHLVLEGAEGVSIRSPRPIVLTSGQSVVAEGPEVSLRAGRLEFWAHRILQKAHDLYSWISGLFQTTSWRYKVEVEETATVRAGRTVVKARGTVNIDGSSIHLG